MSKDKLAKLVFLNLSIAIFNIILFSPGLIGIVLVGGSTVCLALGITSILMSILIFIYGNFRLVFECEVIIKTSELTNAEDFMTGLKQHISKKTFEEDILQVIEQIERIEKKIQTICQILLQKFTANELSYIKFKNTIISVQEAFYCNIKNIINKLNAFEEKEYIRIKKKVDDSGLKSDLINAQLGIFNEYILFIQNAIKGNEQILHKLDRLLLEISKLNTFEEGELENLAVVAELEGLIKQIKYYKN